MTPFFFQFLGLVVVLLVAFTYAIERYQDAQDHARQVRESAERARLELATKVPR